MIIVDSSYFIAISDKRDQWHSKALALKEYVEKADHLNTELNVSEVITEIGRRKGGKAGDLLYKYFKDNCKIAFASEADLDAAEVIFLTYDGKLSLPDSLSLHYLSQYQVNSIVSFDSDFDRCKGLERIF